MNGTPFDVAAYTLLVALALLAFVYLYYVVVDVRTRKNEPSSGTAGLEGQRRSQADVSGDQPATATTEPNEPPKSPAGSPDDREQNADREPSSSVISRDSPSAERRRLQRLLRRGVELEQNARGSFAALAAVTSPTTAEDVSAWEAEVEAELMDRPNEAALFFYEPPRSPLAALAVRPLDNPLGARLRQRNHQLGVIIRRTP